MPRVQADKATTNFKQGFITEATGLTFPENSCRDIDNCDIQLKGTVRRRLGLNTERGGGRLAKGRFDDETFEGASGPYSSIAEDALVRQEGKAVTVHLWPQPASRDDLNLVVFQVGCWLIVRCWNAENTADAGNLAGTITGALAMRIDDEEDGFVYGGTAANAARTPLNSSVGFGRIWFTSKYTIPFYLELNTEDGETRIRMRPVGYDETTAPHGSIMIRDFNGVPDGLRVDEEPTTLTDLHKYNLRNQGWTDALIDEYFNETANPQRYPSNAQQWILGKDAEDNFVQDMLSAQDFGNSPAPRGRLKLHALLGNKTAAAEEDEDFDWELYSRCNNPEPMGFFDRLWCESKGGLGMTPPDGALTIPSTYSERSATGFNCTAFFAGRLWLSGEANQARPNGVYYSKTMSKVEDAGIMHSENDPTSEHFSDLLATDGGVIYITEADRILRMVPFSSGLLVFAANGVWFIYGGEGGFTATNYVVDKISNVGLWGMDSVVRTDNTVLYFGESSIHAVALPERGVVPAVTDIAEERILRFYNQIDPRARQRAQGCYDPISKKVFWSYLSADDYNYPRFGTAFNRMLILDTRTGSYTKYSFTTDTDTNAMMGYVFPMRRLARPHLVTNVVVGTDPVLVDDDQVAVFDDADEVDEFINSVKVIVWEGTEERVRLCEFYDVSFQDFGSWNVSDYTSYVVTGDETLGDLMRNKQATYVYSYFRRTEQGYRQNSDSEQVLIRPSGCTLVARWDWHNTGSGGRWSEPQAAYRYRRPIPADDVDNGEEILYTKLKVRGKGRALTLKYESVSGKDFQLLGYSVPYTATGAPT